MSIELYAYATAADPVLRSDLDQAFAAFGWKYLLFENIESFREASGDFIQSCDVLAWKDNEKTTGRVQEAVSARDSAEVERLFSKDVIGVVQVDLERPYRADPEVVAELRESGVDPAIVDRISEANTFYSVRTSATRNKFSLRVQDLIAKLLAVALYGIFEDPQEGTFENLSREIVEGGA